MTWKIYHGDALNIPPMEVDHMITDPPYDEKTHAGVRASKGAELVLGFEPIHPSTVWSIYKATTKRWGIVFCSLEMLGRYQDCAKDEWIRAGVWDRMDSGAPQFTGDRPGQGAEGIAIMHPTGKKQWNAGGARAIWRHPIIKAVKEHPCEKPLYLMMTLVKQFTNEGDTVLDPFCGSGTTGEACLRLNRNFIGIDIDMNHVKTANKRLQYVEDELQQTPPEQTDFLFDT